MAVLNIVLNQDYRQLSDEIKNCCDRVWESCVAKLGLELAAEKGVIYPDNIFAHPDLLFRSNKLFAAKLFVTEGETRYGLPGFIDKIVRFFKGNRQTLSYFKQYAKRFDALCSRYPEKRTLIKHYQRQLMRIHAESKRVLLCKAANQSENELIDLMFKKGLAQVSCDEMDFSGDFSRKNRLDCNRKLHQLMVKRLALIGKSNLQQEEKAGLIKKVNRAHHFSQAWLDSMERYVNLYSRKYVSRFRRFAQGSLGILGFFSLAGLISAAVLMSGPFAPLVVATAVTTFKLLSVVGLSIGLVSLVSLAVEVSVNKLYYKQNPTKGEFFGLCAAAVLSVAGAGVKAIGNGFVWLGHNLTKLFLQAKGASVKGDDAIHAIEGYPQGLGQKINSSSAFILRNTACRLSAAGNLEGARVGSVSDGASFTLLNPENTPPCVFEACGRVFSLR